MLTVIMYALLALCGWILFAANTGRPIVPFLQQKKKKHKDARGGSATKELEGDWKEIVGIKAIHGNMLELHAEKNNRTFIGAVKTEPINYQLKSEAEKEDTDRNFERLLASINLGPGREVKTAIHIQSRPIEITDQLKPYYEAFPTLDEVAQRYAETLFFPYMQKWQNTVSEFDYVRYIFVILEYTPNMLEGLEENMILAKSQNEFVRLSNAIIANYARMGGKSKVCQSIDLLEAMYFATHKRTGSIEKFRQIVEREGRLSNTVTSDYSRPAYQFTDVDEKAPRDNLEEEQDEKAS